MLYVRDEKVLKHKYQSQLDGWKRGINAYDYDRVVDEINAYVDKKGYDTIKSIDLLRDMKKFEIYEPFKKACVKAGDDPKEAGKFFGAAFFETLLKRKDAEWDVVHTSECDMYEKRRK